MEKRRHHSPAEASAPQAATALASSEVPELAPMPGVQVIWGPIAETMPLAGMTVDEARHLLRGPYNIPPTVPVNVNGRRVTAQHRLVAGEILEFAREQGDKG